MNAAVKQNVRISLSPTLCELKQNAFSQTNWEHELDLLQAPSYDQLCNHLCKAKANDLATDTAIWLQNHINEIAPFEQTDWEFMLDQMNDPSVNELKQHLDKAKHLNSPEVIWLRSYIREIEEKGN